MNCLCLVDYRYSNLCWHKLERLVGHHVVMRACDPLHLTYFHLVPYCTQCVLGAMVNLRHVAPGHA